MDFELTEDQKMFRTMVRDFCTREIEPRAAEWDEADEFPYDTYKKMADAGLCGVHFPEQYGGSGDEVTFTIASEEVSVPPPDSVLPIWSASAWPCTR